MLSRRCKRSSAEDSGANEVGANADQSKRLRHSLDSIIEKGGDPVNHDSAMLLDCAPTQTGRAFAFLSMPAPIEPSGNEESAPAAHRDSGVGGIDYPRPVASISVESSSQVVAPRDENPSASYQRRGDSPPSLRNGGDRQERKRTAVAPEANEPQDNETKNEEWLQLARLKPKVEGVCFDRFFRRWVAKRAGLKKVYFPVYKYGFDRAYELAVATRRGLENDAAAGIRAVGALRPRISEAGGCTSSPGMLSEDACPEKPPVPVQPPRTLSTRATAAQAEVKSGDSAESTKNDSEGAHVLEGAELQTPERSTSNTICWATAAEGSISKTDGFQNRSSPSGFGHGSRNKPELSQQKVETTSRGIRSASASCTKEKDQGGSACTVLSIASFSLSQIDEELEGINDEAYEAERLQADEDRSHAPAASHGEGGTSAGESTAASTTGSEDSGPLRAATSPLMFPQGSEGSASSASTEIMVLDDESMQQALVTASAETLNKLRSTLPAGVHFDFASKRWFAVYSSHESPEATQRDPVRPKERVRIFDPTQYEGSMLKAFHACRSFCGSVEAGASDWDSVPQLVPEQRKQGECQDTSGSSDQGANRLSPTETENPPTADHPRSLTATTRPEGSLEQTQHPQRNRGILGIQPGETEGLQVPSNGHGVNAGDIETNLLDAEFGSETRARTTALPHLRRSQRRADPARSVHSNTFAGQELHQSPKPGNQTSRGESGRSSLRRKNQVSTNEKGLPGEGGCRTDEKSKQVSYVSFSEPITVRYQQVPTESASTRGCSQRRPQNAEELEDRRSPLTRQEERTESDPRTTAGLCQENPHPSYRFLRQQSRELAVRCLLVIFGNLADVCTPALFRLFPQDRCRRVRAVLQHRDLLQSGKHTRVLLSAYFQLFWPLLETRTLPQHYSADYIRRLLNGMHNVAAMHKSLFPEYPLRGELDNREGPYAFLDDTAAEGINFFETDFDEP
uniref:AP2 domain-containing protein n=1 Tax=Toxoplasma gondii COUG TaxID=1074873 RepID=A0A2G8XM63_TOXGO|nr:AP2 domain-containing protein [Toxoplasma gondii COUG]